VPYFMALAMDIRYDNLTVETCNITYNPTAVSQYKTTSRTKILPTDVIVSIILGTLFGILGTYLAGKVNLDKLLEKLPRKSK